MKRRRCSSSSSSSSPSVERAPDALSLPPSSLLLRHDPSLEFDPKHCSNVVVTAMSSSRDGGLRRHAAPVSDASMKLLVLESRCLSQLLKSQQHQQPQQQPERQLVLVDGRGLVIGRDRASSNDKDTRGLLRLKELAVSRTHAEIILDANNRFCLADRGSMHGTTINSQRLSEPKSCSELRELHHLDIIEIGSTKLQVHIHERWACEDCRVKDNVIPTDQAKDDAGRLPLPRQTDAAKKIKSTGSEAHPIDPSERKPQNFETCDGNAEPPPQQKIRYVDRAALRRKQYGTIHSDDVDEFRSKQPGTLHQYSRSPSPQRVASSSSGYEQCEQEAPSVSGVGASLLKKIGWKPGQGIGRDESGITVPIQAIGASGRTGIGMARPEPDITICDTRVALGRSKARQRYYSE